MRYATHITRCCQLGRAAPCSVRPAAMQAGICGGLKSPASSVARERARAMSAFEQRFVALTCWSCSVMLGFADLE